MRWRKSSYCDTYGDACVEVAFTGEVLVRDSKDPDGAVLEFSPQSWDAFVLAAKAGEFDLS